LFATFIRAREIKHAARDTNRIVRPFEWGPEFILEHANGDDPAEIFEKHTADVMRLSDQYYALPRIDDYRLGSDLLSWTSAVHTPSAENNTARARFFPARKTKGDKSRRAVVVLPQWNADHASHVALCRALGRMGIAALRLTLPYHELRRPANLERADFLVCSNVGRTLQSMRQAVLDTRAAVRWLGQEGYERVGIVGTSIGSCTAFLAFAHEPAIAVGVFNHVSGYVADVVWRGISTQHVRKGIEPELSLEELRHYWLPISPMPFAAKLLEQTRRPMRFIAARHDLTFPADLSQEVIARVESLGIPVDVSWLPCGHYTSGERPWVYLDGWKIVSFFRKHL
jgi:dienelactone hydrolase